MLTGKHNTAIERRLNWMAEHGDRTAALLIAEQHRTAERSAKRTDELRSSLASRVGGAGLLDRDELACRCLREIDRPQSLSHGPAQHLAVPPGDTSLDLGG